MCLFHNHYQYRSVSCAPHPPFNRRDSCPAVAKMLEASLRLLFSSKDLSGVKDYCTRQWGKILSNRVSVQVGFLDVQPA